MPRHNLVVLLAVSLISAVCYRQADSAHRSDYGRMFDTFVEVLREVDKRYVRQVDQRVMFEGALEGMVGKLDPYSAYIGPGQFGEFRSSLEQKFGGIGIEVSIDRDTKQVTVMSPIVDSPAYKRGILAGDIILKINGEDTAAMQSQDVFRRLRGKEGETVHLTVLHKGAAEPVEIDVQRAVIPMPAVLGDTRGADDHWSFLLRGRDDIGYIRVPNFGENTVRELKNALEWLSGHHVRGLILDLRNNPGGLFDQATGVCNLFLHEGRIVSTRGRDGTEIDAWEAKGDAPYADLPLVILVNQYTASASEIVAACLQDHQRAIIVGQRTWGKGTVQNVIPLEGGRSLLKLTTASYWRPSGRDIHRHPDAKEQDAWGVSPDSGYEVKLSDADLATQIRHRRELDVIRSAAAAAGPAAPDETSSFVDPQLQKAVAALDELIAHGRGG